MYDDVVEYDPVITMANIFNTIGYLLTVDDIDDYGKFDRIHHWMIGELIRITSLLVGMLRVASIIGGGEDEDIR
ncbi:MAG: hypothetical protein QXQ95_08720 [Thermofilum sp.]|uniref:hypothetical protein n=1 Tax=Thermofilum sp. TaxID=1961369 RepID=UPI003176A452